MKWDMRKMKRVGVTIVGHSLKTLTYMHHCGWIMNKERVLLMSVLGVLFKPPKFSIILLKS